MSYPRRRSNVRTQRHAQPGLEPGLSDPESSTLTTGLLTPLLNILNAFIFVLYTLNQPGLLLVVARARNCGSTTNIYCRNIDNSGSGVGKPFQLRRSENTSFWTNEDVENEGIKVGCMLEYRVLTCYQSPLGRYCKLGKRDGKQFIFHRNDRKPPLVSFH